LERSKDHQRLSNGDLDIKEYIKYGLQNECNIVIEVKDEDNLRDSVAFLQEALQTIKDDTSVAYIQIPSLHPQIVL
jgi:hypothetical protein